MITGINTCQILIPIVMMFKKLHIVNFIYAKSILLYFKRLYLLDLVQLRSNHTPSFWFGFVYTNVHHCTPPVCLHTPVALRATAPSMRIRCASLRTVLRSASASAGRCSNGPTNPETPEISFGRKPQTIHKDTLHCAVLSATAEETAQPRGTADAA